VSPCTSLAVCYCNQPTAHDITYCKHIPHSVTCKLSVNNNNNNNNNIVIITAIVTASFVNVFATNSLLLPFHRTFSLIFVQSTIVYALNILV